MRAPASDREWSASASPPPPPPPQDAAPARPARPAASMLHPYGPQTAQLGDSSLPPAHFGFYPNPLLRLAQLTAVAQGVLALITGVNLINGGITLTRLGTGVSLPQSSTVTMSYGIVLVVIGALIIVAAILVTRPSPVARWLLVLFEVIALGASLAAHFGGGSVLGLVTVVAMGSGGSGMIPIAAVLGIQAALIYALALHPPTYGAFAE